jgi:hypothetical protein
MDYGAAHNLVTADGTFKYWTVIYGAIPALLRRPPTASFRRNPLHVIQINRICLPGRPLCANVAWFCYSSLRRPGRLYGNTC